MDAVKCHQISAHFFRVPTEKTIIIARRSRRKVIYYPFDCPDYPTG